jgi:hypothetical protein
LTRPLQVGEGQHSSTEATMLLQVYRHAAALSVAICTANLLPALCVDAWVT